MGVLLIVVDLGRPAGGVRDGRGALPNVGQARERVKAAFARFAPAAAPRVDHHLGEVLAS